MSLTEDVATDKSRIVAYCTNEMKRKLERLADLRFRSVSNLIEAVLAEEIARAEASGELKPSPEEKSSEGDRHD